MRSPNDLKGKVVALFINGYRTARVERVAVKGSQPGMITIRLLGAGRSGRAPYKGPKFRVEAAKLDGPACCGVQWRGKIVPLTQWLSGGA